MTKIAKAKPRIPIFFAFDNNYMPHLAVTLASIEAHASDDYEYEAFILTEGFCEERLSTLLEMKLPHVKVRTVDVTHRIEAIREKLSSTLQRSMTVLLTVKNTVSALKVLSSTINL